MDVTGTTETVAFTSVVMDGKDYTGGADLSSKVNAIVLAPTSRRWEGRDETVTPNALCSLRAPEDKNADGAVDRITNPYMQSTNNKSGITTVSCANVKTVLGSELRILEPEEVPVVPGQTTDVPFMYESADAAWQIVTAPTAPSGCTMSPGSQEVQVSTSGALETKALVWEMSCSDTALGGASKGVVKVALAAEKKGKGRVSHDVEFKNAKQGGKVTKKTRLDGEFDVSLRPHGNKPRVQARVTLEQGGTLWSVVKKYLLSNGQSVTSDEEVRKAVVTAALLNKINISEWGVNGGGVDHRLLPVGFVLYLSGL